MDKYLEKGTERLLDVLQVGHADILHRALNRLKSNVIMVHHQNHDFRESWRECECSYCVANRPIVEEAEVLLYGKVQED